MNAHLLTLTLIFMSILELNVCTVRLKDGRVTQEGEISLEDEFVKQLNEGVTQEEKGVIQDDEGVNQEESVTKEDINESIIGQGDNEGVTAEDNSGDSSVGALDNGGSNHLKLNGFNQMTVIPFDQAKVKYHRTSICVTVAGKPHCVYLKEEPGDPAKVASQYKMWASSIKSKKLNVKRGSD